MRRRLTREQQLVLARELRKRVRAKDAKKFSPKEKEATRRMFFMLVGAAGLTAAAQLLGLKPVDASRFLDSESSKTLAKGFFIGSDGKPYGEPVEIVGTQQFFYLVKVEKKVKPVSMDDILIVEGHPFPDYVQDSRLGYRVDYWGMEIVYKSGASFVRIAGSTDDLGKDSDFERGFQNAENHKLPKLVVFNPAVERSDDYYREKIRILLAKPNIIIELGNEMDNTQIKFWKNQNYKTFAHFVKVCLDEIRRVRPQTKVVLGALVWVGNTPNLLAALRNEGVNLNGLAFGVHAYQSANDVVSRTRAVREFLSQYGVKNPELWMTELGVMDASYRRKNVLVKMIKTCLDLGYAKVTVHQLLDYKESSNAGFGVVSPDLKITYPVFYEVVALVRALAGK